MEEEEDGLDALSQFDEIYYSVTECEECDKITPLLELEHLNGIKVYVCIYCKSEIDDHDSIIEVSSDELTKLGFDMESVVNIADSVIELFKNGELEIDEKRMLIKDFFNEPTEVYFK